MRGDTAGGVHATIGQQYRSIAKCWRAFCKGETLTVLRISPDDPLEIYGTPWSKRARANGKTA